MRTCSTFQLPNCCWSKKPVQIARKFLKYKLGALPDHILKEILKPHSLKHFDSGFTVSSYQMRRSRKNSRKSRKINTYILEFSVRNKRRFKSEEKIWIFQLMWLK